MSITDRVLPRPEIANPSLSRPDWTTGGRKASSALPLDKNENTDPFLHGIIRELMMSVPLESVTQYPDCVELYAKLAAHLGIRAQNLLLTAGSDGAIRTVFETYVSVGDVVMRTEPTFAMYPVYTSMFGGEPELLSYRPSVDGPVLLPEEIRAGILKLAPRLLCLPNADSPTGSLLSLDEIESIVSTAEKVGTVVLLDEAYYPFSEVTGISLIDRYQNLIVTRTFAKAWGLAGLRIGFAAAHPDTAVMLHKVRPMYEVNGYALSVVSQLIDRSSEVGNSVARINAGRDQFKAKMSALGLKTLSGGGNFVHVAFAGHEEEVHRHLKDKVLYRPRFSEACLNGFSRFTTAPEQVMDTLVSLIENAINR